MIRQRTIGNGATAPVQTPQTSPVVTALIVAGLVLAGMTAIGLAYRYSPCQERKRQYRRYLDLGAPRAASDVRADAQATGCEWARSAA